MSILNRLLPISRPIRLIAEALRPHWAALLMLALFLAAGLAVLDDYGVTRDERVRRQDLQANARYVASGDLDAFLIALPNEGNRFYGVAFEGLILSAERAFGVDDGRGFYLTRHLITHLCYLAGGLFVYLLARRLFGARLPALMAMGLFLLHPRLYAHSFFNSSDIPFLALFAFGLHLTHWAFRRDRGFAFALLGAAVGFMVNLRIMGVILFAAVPAMRALDLVFAQGWSDRRRILISTGAFALACGLTAYVLLPYLWADPIERSVEWWETLANRSHGVPQLFRGVVHLSADLPREYLPVWFSIASPPFALPLGLIGAAVIVGKGAKAPLRMLRNRGARFSLLLVAAFALPALAVALLGAGIYSGWRHMYFLWAPFALLAAFGLQWVASAFGRRFRGAVYGAAGLGLAATLISMALLHPNQQVYFNALVDRVAPEHLRTQYVMDYWSHSVRQGFEWVLDQAPSPGEPVSATTINLSYLDEESRRILPNAERLLNDPGLDALNVRRVASNAANAPFDPPEEGSGRALHRVKVYGNTLLTVEEKPDLRAVYEAAPASEPIEQSVFDVYRMDRHLALVKEPCSAAYLTELNARMRVTAADRSDLPYWRQERGTEAIGFSLSGHGAVFDGKCAALVPLPDYAVADVRVILSPLLPDEGAVRESARRARERGRLLGAGAYDVYLSDGELVYVKEQCDPDETEERFFLHVVPERVSDLPEGRRRYGFANMDFDFFLRGALLGGKCAAMVPLPEHAIASIRTGQFVRGEGEIWRAEFEVGG